MDTINLLIGGLATALSPINLMYAVIGGILGIIVGALPGIGSGTGISLLLPLTFKMNPTSAIIMLAGIYYGNMFGGAYSAILLNIPGDSPAVCTALDGYQLTKKGLGGKALMTANISSFIGGLIGIILLTICGPLLAEIGLKFGPTEIAALIFFALTSIGWLLGEDPLKGLISAGIGILIATIGVDSSTGKFRYFFGNFNLIGGISFVPLVIGMFGFSQIFEMMGSRKETESQEIEKLTIKDSLLSIKELKSIIPTSLRSSIIGNFIGFLPGAGATTASFISYVLEKNVGKRGKHLGTGEITGVAASESANNAASVGSFGPLLSLGLPGSTTSAVLLGGLMMWGLRPGPLLFESNPDFVWGLIGSMYVGNLICLIIGTFLLSFLVSFLNVKKETMVPIVMIICFVGAYSCNNNVFDLIVVIVSGYLAFMLKKYGFPTTPVLLAFVLSPKLELSLRQALGISHGKVNIFFQKPISAVLIVITLFMFTLPMIRRIYAKKKKAGK